MLALQEVSMHAAFNENKIEQVLGMRIYRILSKVFLASKACLAQPEYKFIQARAHFEGQIYDRIIKSLVLCVISIHLTRCCSGIRHVQH